MNFDMNFEITDKWKKELDRPSTKLLEGKTDLVICEIGTEYGINAKDILERFDIKTFYLIDPYVTYNGIREGSISGEDGENVKKFAKEYLKEYEDKLVWIEKFSWDAVNDIPDNLDFVYIDGEHTEEAVTKDMELYYPKVKVGGVFAGHDFEINRAPGVVKAVVEFFHKLSKSNKNCKTVCYSGVWDWWYIKV